MLIFTPTFIVWGDANNSPENKEARENKVSTGENKDNKDSEKASKDSAEVKNLEFFDTINLSALGTLHLKQSDEPNFTIEADKKILPLITVYVKDKILYIDMKESSENTNPKVDYYLNIKNIKTINSLGSGGFVMNDFKAKELQLTISNLGEANMSGVNIQKLTIHVDGGGKIKAEGIAEQQIVEIKGAGEFNGRNLAGKQGIFTINGSGIMSANVSDALTINISGDGTVKYCGHPTITKNVSPKAVVSPTTDCP